MYNKVQHGIYPSEPSEYFSDQNVAIPESGCVTAV
jgi:hypothetical protein